MPRLQFLEPVSHEGVRYEKGNTHEVSADFAKIATENGWAKDLDDKLPLGERSTFPKSLAPQPVRSGSAVKKG